MTETEQLAFEDYLDEGLQFLIEGNYLSHEVPEKNIQDGYALAYQLYQNKLYQQASFYFRVLVTACPTEGKFWKGLAASLQMQKEYHESLNCYMSCLQISSRYGSDPYFFVQIADCHFALKNVKEGLEVLEIARTLANKSKDNKVLNHVKFMKEAWSKNHCIKN